jgi:hypothetical protein
VLVLLFFFRFVSFCYSLFCVVFFSGSPAHVQTSEAVINPPLSRAVSPCLYQLAETSSLQTSAQALRCAARTAKQAGSTKAGVAQMADGADLLQAEA